jgi:hypothetical protein
MNTHADKAQENKSQAVANSLPKLQSNGNGESTFQFVDNRPEAIAQRKLQESINNSPRVKQLKAYQEMANNSPQVKHAVQLQTMADNYSAKQQQPAQNKENNTGLPDNLKTGMENLSGMSLDDVKVHHNSDKPAQLQAHAYAQGTDIHLGPGQEKHLPHEAWHVVQQKQGRVKPTMQMKGKVNVNDDAGLEKEADVMGAKFGSVPIQAKISLIEHNISTKVLQGKLYIGDSQQAETKETADADKLNQSNEIMKGIYEIIDSSEELRLDDWVRTIYYVIEKFNIFNIEKFWDDNLVMQEFVTEEHMKAIGTYCKQKNIILSVRDTGKLSLDRIKEGAKPKPHSILEKSIKESSLVKAHPEVAEALKSGVELEVPPAIGGVSITDLKGFVGHWDNDSGELLGVRVDKRDVRASEVESVESTSELSDHEKRIQSLQVFLSGKDSDSPYISLAAFKEYKIAFDTKWQQFLYTGDYDLHEVYKHNKTLLEGSKEKASLLSGINKQIAKDQKSKAIPLREGVIESHQATAEIGEGNSKRTVPSSTLHTSDNSEYAMIQHGDQMGYITNQIHEGRLKEETLNDKAQLVGAVASEAPGPLAWCVRGNWYVTKNVKEHSELRTGLSLTASSGWQAKAQEAMADGSSRIMEHKKNTPSKIGVLEQKPYIKNKGKYTPGANDVMPL